MAAETEYVFALFHQPLFYPGRYLRIYRSSTDPKSGLELFERNAFGCAQTQKHELARGRFEVIVFASDHRIAGLLNPLHITAGIFFITPTLGYYSPVPPLLAAVGARAHTQVIAAAPVVYVMA